MMFVEFQTLAHPTVHDYFRTRGAHVGFHHRLICIPAERQKEFNGVDSWMGSDRLVCQKEFVNFTNSLSGEVVKPLRNRESRGDAYDNP
jgi:hypothetical protein